MRWWVDGLVPNGHLTMLIGDGGIGKSFLGLHLSLCVATGTNFLGREVEQGRVLFLDHELNLNEQKRRVLKIARGMGLDIYGEEINQNIYYCSPDYPLGTKYHQKDVSPQIKRYGIDLVLLDSLTKGAKGDMTTQKDFSKVSREISGWPTTVAIDHVSKKTASNSHTENRAFGSVFKRNTARSSLGLRKVEDGMLRLRQEKSNFSEAGQTLYLSLSFGETSEGQTVTLKPQDPAEEKSYTPREPLNSKAGTLQAVQETFEETGEPVSVSEVSAWRSDSDRCKSIGDGTINNHLREHERAGKLDRKEHGIVPQ